MEYFKILGLCVLCAVVYGLVHDQVTVRICVEYFTIGHPKVIESTNPTVLALVWGVIATWWAGAIVGCLLALAAQVGNSPRLTARELFRPILWVFAAMAMCATLAGVIAYVCGVNGVYLVPDDSVVAMSDRWRVGFITCLWAHNTSYGVAAIGGLALIVWTRWKRRRLAMERMA